MFAPRLWALCVFAFVLALVPASTSAAPTGAQGDARIGPVVIDDVSQDPEDVVDYWTKKRMINALPVDFAPFDLGAAFSDGGGGLSNPSAFQPTGQPASIPQDRGSMDASYSVVPRCSPACGGDIEANPDPFDQDGNGGGFDNTAFPFRVHGRIFATNPALGRNLTCSGTIVNSPLANLIVTAGHCLFGAGSGNQFFTNWTFVPGYYYGNTPFGSYPAGELLALSGWTAGAGFSHDVGMAKLGLPIQNTLGARGIAFNQTPSQVWDQFGYPARPNPADDGFGDYDGERLIACNDATTRGLENTGTPPSVGAAYCYMQQGASGGGWVLNGQGIVNSVVSHGYCHQDPGHTIYPNGPCGIFFGPYFGNEVQALYNQAASIPTTPTCKKKKKKKKKKNRSAQSSKKKKKKNKKKCKK